MASLQLLQVPQSACPVPLTYRYVEISGYRPCIAERTAGLLMIQKCNSKQQGKNTINRARRGTRHDETSKRERKDEKEMKKCRSELLVKEERRRE